MPSGIAEQIIRNRFQQKQDAHKVELDALDTAVKSGATPDQVSNLAGTMQTVTAAELNHYYALTGILRGNEKKQQKIAEATDPKVLSTLGQSISQQPGAQPGQMVDAPDDVQRQVGLMIAQKLASLQGLPQDDQQMAAGRIMEGVGAARFGTQSAATADVAGAQSAAAQQFSNQNRLSAAGTSRTNAENRRELAIKAKATELGAVGSGLSNADTSPEAVTASFQALGYGVREARQMAAESLLAAGAEKVELGKWAKGNAGGKGVDIRQMEATKREYLREFPSLADMDPQELEDKLTKEQGGTAVLDSWLASEGQPEWIRTTSQKDSDRISAKRRDQMELDQQLNLTIGTLDTLTKSGKAGPGTWAGAYDAAAFAGLQPGEVAGYRNASSLFAASLLKAAQGARPSEFDLKLYLALLPSLSEIGTPAAAAKMQQLKTLNDMYKAAPHSASVRKKLAEMSNRVSGSGRGAAIDAIVAKARAEAGDDPANPKPISDATQKELLQAMDPWQNSKEGQAIREKFGGDEAPAAGPGADFPKGRF